MSDNLNYVFNKEYFKGFYEQRPNHVKAFKEANQKLINFQFHQRNSTDVMEEAIRKHPNYIEKSFKVLYPGLIIGIGNVHEANVDDKAQTELIKLGFSFDYVSGLPYLPGSSVKGILRSAFEGKKYQVVRDTLKAYITPIGDITAKAKEIVDAKGDLSQEEKDSLIKKEKLRLRRKEIALIEKAIFGENVHDTEKNDHEDVFLDAIIESGSTDGRIIKGGNLLDYEYITSHLADDPKYQGLTAPNPVRLLKIRPGVKIKFRFILTDTTVKNPDTGKEITIKKDTKLQLFKEIIKLFGVGAKTNVGYGQLEEA